jgi:Kef-type K+ transport system membrane component KefB
MSQTAEFLFTIGAILLLGLAADYLGRRTFLPRVSLILVFGVLVGDEALGIIPETITQHFEVITNIALLMIGFLLGGKLTINSFRQYGRLVGWISISATLATTAIVTFALVIFGVNLDIAILLGCIAAATAPAATVDVVLESGDESAFSRLLLGIVAIDDAWALLLFSLGLALVSLLNSMDGDLVPVIDAFHEIFGAMILGIVIGLPAAYLTGRLKPGQPMLTEALGLVFTCGGLVLWLDVSFLIAAMTMGAVIANLAKHHDYPFHEIENIEWPFMVIFFLLAGASLKIGVLTELSLIGIVYLLARICGKLIGAWLGAVAGHAGEEIRHWTGMAMMPQAGVAIGMALLTANRFPEYEQAILAIVIGSTVFFELVGPVFTRMALKHMQHVKIR